MLAALLALKAALGLMVGRIEKWTAFDSIYFAIITALTVGYGDIAPRSIAGKSLTMLIALLGIAFTGILVAVAVQSLQRTYVG